MGTTTPPLARRLLAEAVGSAFLAAVVVGSGIAAQRLSPGDVGLQLLENAAATAVALYAIILMVGPISGAHLNPVVSVVDAALGGMGWRHAAAYLPVATLGLLLVIFALARTGRSASAPAAVGAYIGAAYFFTSSTSFANPAITVGRTLSDSFAGIEPASVGGYVVAQVAGAALALVLIRALYPEIPHPEPRLP